MRPMMLKRCREAGGHLFHRWWSPVRPVASIVRRHLSLLDCDARTAARLCWLAKAATAPPLVLPAQLFAPSRCIEPVTLLCAGAPCWWALTPCQATASNCVKVTAASRRSKAAVAETTETVRVVAVVSRCCHQREMPPLLLQEASLSRLAAAASHQGHCHAPVGKVRAGPQAAPHTPLAR